MDARSGHVWAVLVSSCYSAASGTPVRRPFLLAALKKCCTIVGWFAIVARPSSSGFHPLPFVAILPFDARTSLQPRRRRHPSRHRDDRPMETHTLAFASTRSIDCKPSISFPLDQSIAIHRYLSICGSVTSSPDRSTVESVYPSLATVLSQSINLFVWTCLKPRLALTYDQSTSPSVNLNLSPSIHPISKSFPHPLSVMQP